MQRSGWVSSDPVRLNTLKRASFWQAWWHLQPPRGSRCTLSIHPWREAISLLCKSRERIRWTLRGISLKSLNFATLNENLVFWTSSSSRLFVAVKCLRNPEFTCKRIWRKLIWKETGSILEIEDILTSWLWSAVFCFCGKVPFIVGPRGKYWNANTETGNYRSISRSCYHWTVWKNRHFCS